MWRARAAAAERDQRPLDVVFARRPFVNLEYAVPLERFEEMVGQLRAVFARHPESRLTSLNFRPVGADDAGYLAASKDGPVVYVDIGYVVELEAFGLYTDAEAGDRGVEQAALVPIGGVAPQRAQLRPPVIPPCGPGVKTTISSSQPETSSVTAQADQECNEPAGLTVRRRVLRPGRRPAVLRARPARESRAA
jgi:hypothetical protein